MAAPYTQAQIIAEANSLFPDNTSGMITPAILRQFQADFAGSVIFAAGVSPAGDVHLNGTLYAPLIQVNYLFGRVANQPIWTFTDYNFSMVGQVNILDSAGSGALATASRSSDWNVLINNNSVTQYSLSVHDRTTGGYPAGPVAVWNNYWQSNRTATSYAAIGQFVAEASFQNMGVSVPSDPFNINPAGLTAGIRVDSGIGPAVGNPVSTAYEAVYNGNVFHTAFLVGDASVASPFRAIKMPVNYLLSWYAAASDVRGEMAVDSNGIFQMSGGLSINPTAASSKLAISATQTGAGTISSVPNANGFSYNRLYIPAQGLVINTGTVPAGRQIINGFLTEIYPNNGSKGNIQGIAGTVIVPPLATIDTSANWGYLGSFGLAKTSTNLGGTNTGAGSLGSVFGGNFVAIADTTNLYGAVGAEIDVQTFASSTMARRIGLSIVDFAPSNSQGALVDAALVITASGTPIGWVNGILFCNNSGGHPMDTTNGVLMATSGASNAKTGIDISSYTFSGNAFKSTAFAVDGSGNVTGVSASLTSNRAAILTNQVSSAAGTTGTLTNSPTVGNPGFWVPIKINGTNYAFPAWLG